MLTHHAPLSRHHANSVAGKEGQSRHHAMHDFHAITLIIFLFHESRLEKMANLAITPTAGVPPILAPISIKIAYAVRTHIQLKMIEKRSCENNCSS